MWDIQQDTEIYDTFQGQCHYDQIPYFQHHLILWTGKCYDVAIAHLDQYISRLQIQLSELAQDTEEGRQEAWLEATDPVTHLRWWSDYCFKQVPIMSRDYYTYDTWEEADEAHQRIKQYLEQFAETRRLFGDVVEAMEQERLARLKEMIEQRDKHCRTAYFSSILEKWNKRDAN